MSSTPVPARSGRRRLPRPGRGGRALAFLLPAALLLTVFVVYPTIATFVRSLYSDNGGHFVWFENYGTMFTLDETRTAIKNNAIWVVVAPSIVTALGLIFAVLAERIRWQSAFKVVVFMPMAISFLASGVIFGLVYQADPDQGLANAVAVGVHDTFASSSQYPDARARPTSDLRPQGKALALTRKVGPGRTVLLPLVGLPPAEVPASAATAAAPPLAGTESVTGTVWFDFTRGGGGTAGAVDPTEKGLPGMRVVARQGDTVVASTRTRADGTFVLSGLATGGYTVELPASNFAKPYAGVSWLGPSFVTPAIIGAYIWMWAGFAMVLIGAGLAAIPRDALEAARVDGATEMQVFRRVTVPLLAPVLAVVLVTLVINVLKVFDLVLIIAPGSSQASANVLALEMWRVSFGGDPKQGLGSALAIFLFLLVVPAMLFNIRRFRREG